MRRFLPVLAFAASVITVPAHLAAADSGMATVGSRTITTQEVEKHVRGRLMQLELERYEALKAGLDELVANELLTQEAKARGVSFEALIRQEIDAKLSDPTDADIQKFAAENMDRLGGTVEQMKPQIVSFLKDQRKQERRAALVTGLKTKYKTTVALKAPVYQVATAGRPERGGGAKAPVTILQFTDYECGFCKQAEATLDQVLKTYGDKVRIVVRNLPLEMHTAARPAAEAAACANAQGKFWEYHAHLFANQASLGKAQLEEYALKLGLDGPKFQACLNENPFKAMIDQDLEAASEVGLGGTPVFFVNGRMLQGALPFDSFKQAIDDVLGPAVAQGPAGAAGGDVKGR